MNQRILSTLGFDKVKQQLLQFIVTAQGTNEVSELLPIADENKIQSWLNETQDGLKVQRLRGGIPIPKLENIQPHMILRELTMGRPRKCVLKKDI